MAETLLILSLVQTALAQHSHGGSDSGNATMVPYLHFRPGDTLFFEAWTPTKPGPVFATCLGLFLLAILDRFFAAVRRLAEVWWSDRARIMVAQRFEALDTSTVSEEEKTNPRQVSLNGERSTRAGLSAGTFSRKNVPPFIASHDLARGAFVVVQSAITYALMLTVMTFNAGFIISVLVGLGTGEVLFGRLAYVNADH